MTKFGISFQSKNAKTSHVPPRGFSLARLSIGSLSETIYSDQSIWSEGDYLTHWKKTASRCISDRESVVFCSSLSQNNANVWPAILLEDVLRFYSFVSPISDLLVVDYCIFPRASFETFMGERSDDWSSWEVQIGELKSLALET